MATSLLSGAVRDNEVVHVTLDKDADDIRVVSNHADVEVEV